jgi:hypothetical protein
MRPPSELLKTSSNSHKPSLKKYCDASMVAETSVGTKKMNRFRGNNLPRSAPSGMKSHMLLRICRRMILLLKKQKLKGNIMLT